MTMRQASPRMDMEECCSRCRQPVRQCSDSSCDDAGTYTGILLRGQWLDLDREEVGAVSMAMVSVLSGSR